MKLFVDNAPADKWQQISDDLLSQYPRLGDYESFVHNIIGEALKRHDAIERLWEEAGASASGPPHRPENARLIEADSKSAKLLFQRIFDSEARGRVEATKGKFSLTFVVDEVDARNVYLKGMASGQLLEETPLGFSVPGAEIPVLVINRNEREPQAELVATAHEAQHIQHSIVREGRYRTLQQIEAEGGGAALEKALKREQDGLPIEELAKDELLAQFTYLQLLEASRSTNAELDRRFDEVVSEIAERAATIADPNGYYFRKFQKIFSPTTQEQERFQQNVVRAVDAYIQLWKLYAQNKSGKDSLPQNNVFIKVSNILDQFPLYKWPAVARICEVRHRAGNLGSKPAPRTQPL